MSNVVVFDPLSPVVANRVTNYLMCVNTPDYMDRTDTLINPDLSSVLGLPRQYWQVTDSSTVVGMSDSDQTVMNNFLLAKTVRQKKYRVVTYSNNHMQQEIWFDTSLGQGQYDGMAEMTSYVYDSNGNLATMVITSYYYDGSPVSTETHNYYKNNQGQIIEKIE